MIFFAQNIQAGTIHPYEVYFMTETPKFKRKRAVTLPTIKFEYEKPVYVKILGEMHVGKVRLARGQTEPDPDKKPPTLCHVIDLSTGEETQIILAEVLKSELSDAYPNHAYVGKGFEIVKQKRKEGKKYDPYMIAEIELPPEFAGKPDTEKSTETSELKKTIGGPRR